MAEYISFQPSDFFNTVLYTGNGASGNAQTGVGFQPDMLWLKGRSNAQPWGEFDALRGGSKILQSNTNAGQLTDANAVESFDVDGFTVGTDSNYNYNTYTYASWNWKAGTASGITGGTITPTSYSINTTSGFGIYEFTGTGSAGTIAHGLGATPTMMIVKKTNTTGDWYVYHKDMPSGNGYHVTLNTNAAEASGTEWNSTDPTSTVFSLGANSNVNASGATFIAYVFAPVKGFSKFGEYWGNGQTSDGTFVYTGFKPALVIAKRSGSAEDWIMFDNKRRDFNPQNEGLRPNSTAEELTDDYIDLLSNGFKWRASTAMGNGSGDTYIYMACAESPIVSSNNIPGVGR